MSWYQGLVDGGGIPAVAIRMSSRIASRATDTVEPTRRRSAGVVQEPPVSFAKGASKSASPLAR
jgi:hypothetical protein